MKKLKKVWMLALLAAGFAMVIGCSSGSSDDDTKEPTPNPTENPTDPGDKTPETEPDGVVEIDGEKYYRVTVDGYKTTIGLDPAVDLKGKTKFKAVMFGEKDNADLQFVVKLADADSMERFLLSSWPLYQKAQVKKKPGFLRNKSGTQ